MYFSEIYDINYEMVQFSLIIQKKKITQEYLK